MNLKEFRYNEEDFASELILDISRAIIPFSKIGKHPKPSDIYSGLEDIPFQKRAIEYKQILKQEFMNA